jgi:hypothetical protein
VNVRKALKYLNSIDFWKKEDIFKYYDVFFSYLLVTLITGVSSLAYLLYTKGSPEFLSSGQFLVVSAVLTFAIRFLFSSYNVLVEMDRVEEAEKRHHERMEALRASQDAKFFAKNTGLHIVKDNKKCQNY